MSSANSPRRKSSEAQKHGAGGAPGYRWMHSTCRGVAVRRRPGYGRAPAPERLDSVCGNRSYPDYYVCCGGLAGLCEECRSFHAFQEQAERRRLGLLPLHLDQANHWREEARSEFARAMDELRAMAQRSGARVELPAEALPSEDVADLVTEIARYRETGRVIVLYDDDTVEEIVDPEAPAPPGPAQVDAPTPRRKRPNVYF